MKVKFKLTVEQFQFLLYYFQNCYFDGFTVTELQILNVRIFVKYGLKKLIDLKMDKPYNTHKQFTFSIDVNQYCSIMSILTNERKDLDPYLLAVFCTLQNQNKELLRLN